MAGIWQGWTDKATGEYVETFAVVTTKSESFDVAGSQQQKKNAYYIE